MTAGLIHYCRKNHSAAKSLFSRALSINRDNDLARLMLYLIDYITGQADISPHREALISLDWRSPAEFFGYLATIVSGKIDIKPAVTMGDTDQEASLLNYVAGFIKAQQGKMDEAEAHFRKALFKASGSDRWSYLMAMAGLEALYKTQLETMPESPLKITYQSESDEFIQSIHKRWTDKVKTHLEIAKLEAKLNQDTVSLPEKQAIVHKILAKYPQNAKWLIQSAYYYAMDEKWDLALEQMRPLIHSPGRESAARLSGGLLQPLLLNRFGRTDEATARLNAFQKRIKDPWYKEISRCLLDPAKETSLAEKAGQQPVYLVTGHTALGLWAEGNDDFKKALRHYKEALRSYRDDRIEYLFAGERIKKLQKTNIN
jgi:tetratricopeptide (TPR) repeat protein